jgi:hypothetical protein
VEDLTVGVGDGSPPDGAATATPLGGAQSAFDPPARGVTPDPSGGPGRHSVVDRAVAFLRSLGGSPRARRAAAALAALVAFSAVLSLGLVTVVAGRGGRTAIPERAVAAPVLTTSDPAASAVRTAAVTPLLTRRSTAVLSGRRAEWAGTLDTAPAAAAFRTRQLAEYDRIRLLPVRAWRYQVVETAPLTAGPGPDAAFTARVRLAYRLVGDTRDVERTQSVTVEKKAAGWALTAARQESTEADPWELGPLTVTQGRRSVVIGIGRDQDRAVLRRTAQEADAASARVDEVWGGTWRRTAVVIVPTSPAHLAGILGRADVAGLEQVAAVTNGELSREPRASSGAADRVVLNPAPFARLTAPGRRIVLTHELAHVATRASARVTVPMWVEEGFANYVAYRGSGLSRAAVAADVLPLVRAGTAASELPEEARFDPADGAIAPAYADAWLAFDLMARGGPRKPLDFYRAAAGIDTPSGEGPLPTAQALAGAFRRVLGTDEETFTGRWRAYREELAGTSR